MDVKQAVLAEFDQEMAVTRRLLARIPEAQFGWRPHERSMTLGHLAMHLAKIPRWGSSILARDRHDIAEDPERTGDVPETLSEILSTFDRHVSDVRGHLVGLTDGMLDATWSLARGGHVLLSFPRFAAFERFVINHAVHHRGQLSVYLRLQNVPLPPMYGPTADEGM